MTPGAVALLSVLFLIAFAGLVALWTYHWVRRKIQSAWLGG